MMLRERFRATARRIIRDLDADDYVAELDRAMPDWRELPVEERAEELRAITAELKAEADDVLDTYNATRGR